MRFTFGILFGMAIVGGMAVSAAQAPAPPALPTDGAALQAQAQVSSLRQALASKLSELGKCQTDLGPLNQLEAQVLTGQMVEAKQAAAAFVAQVEKANPGKTIDLATAKIVDKPKAEPVPAASSGS